jgi:galactonate dehydratase
MKVASLAEAHYIDLMPHNPWGSICTAATIHLAAAVPNFAWLEIRESPTEHLGLYDAELFPVQPQPEGSRFPVPDLPGLGVEFNEELAVERAFVLKPGIFLRRHDGSLTNW